MVPDRELETYAESAIFRDDDDGFIDGRLGAMRISGDFLEEVDDTLLVSRVEANDCSNRSSSCFLCLEEMLDRVDMDLWKGRTMRVRASELRTISLPPNRPHEGPRVSLDAS